VTTDPPRVALVALSMLTLVTGIIDAGSVLGLGHVFAANMTGNVVFLGFALAGADPAISVAATLTALGCFLLGALLGGRVTRTLDVPALRRGFSLEWTLLVTAAVVSTRAAPAATLGSIALLSVGMGLRNAMVRRLAVADMTTTVLTLTLTGLAADSSLAGGHDPRWRRRVASVLAMLLGALAGALCLRWGLCWVLAAAALLEGVAIVLLTRSGLVVAEPALR
jgi:uncharacterized membrane protein YoaK (UPF0700 family)